MTYFQDVTPLYSQRTNRNSKTPVFYCTFGPVFNYTGTDAGSLALTNSYSTGPIRNQTVHRNNWMLIPMQSSNSISVLAGTSSISSMNFEILDKNGEITKLTQLYPMKNRIITIYGGYTDINESDFTPLYTGICQNIQMSNGITVQFYLKDFFQPFKANVFSLQTYLVGDITAAQTSITVQDFSLFATATNSSSAYPSVANYIRIGDEYMSYTAASQNPDGTWAVPVTRGVTVNSIVTVAANHSDGDTISNAVYLHANPLTIALWVLASTGLGTNYTPGFTNYDVLTAQQGASIPIQYIDQIGIEKQRDQLIPNDLYTFVWQDQIDAKKFCEENIFKVCNAYPVVKVSGQLGVKVFALSSPAVGVPIIDDTNLAGVPQFVGNFQTGQTFFNELELDFDYDSIKDQFNTLDFFEDTTSQSTYAEVSTLKIEGKGILTSDNGQTIANRTSNTIFTRFAIPPPQFVLKVFYTLHPVNVGDLVLVTSAALPDSLTGLRGGAGTLCEVINRSVDYVGGFVTLTVLSTQANLQHRYGFISPANYPDYTAATSFQKQYAFLATQTVAYSAGSMSNGDDGYYIQA